MQIVSTRRRGLPRGALRRRDLAHTIKERSVRGEDITSFTAPTGEPFTTARGAQVLAVDDEAMAELRSALADGRVEAYAAEHAN